MKEIFRGCGAKKIHQGNEIYAVCKKMRATFTANDIKEILMQSDSEKMRSLSAGHISARLCKLAQDQKILLVRKRGGRGSPNEYKRKGKIIKVKLRTWYPCWLVKWKTRIAIKKHNKKQNCENCPYKKAVGDLLNKEK